MDADYARAHLNGLLHLPAILYFYRINLINITVNMLGITIMK